MHVLLSSLLAMTVLHAGSPQPTIADGTTDCVSGQEYRTAHAAWMAEGLTRPGIRYYFGFDGKRVLLGHGVMKRRYRGCGGVHVTVRYRHFQEAPGPTGVWWVVVMGRGE